MTVSTPPSLLALHGLRLAGCKPAEDVAASVGLPTEVVDAELATLAGAGLAVFREGRLRGWTLTPAGRAEGERRLAAELDEAGCRAEVEACYRAFLALNGPMLAVCTDWQLRPADATADATADAAPTLNDHTDPAYDAAVVERLAELDARIRPVCARLGGCLRRFDGYGGRLAHALDRVRAGDTDWFTKPMIASYHSVWFELHEDLLATLNIDRATEGRA